jgi:hypothetical protein
MLQHDNANDMTCIREAARYAPYALGIYENYQQALLMAGRFTADSPEVFHPCIVERDGNGNFRRTLCISHKRHLEDYDLVSLLQHAGVSDIYAHGQCCLSLQSGQFAT